MGEPSRQKSVYDLDLEELSNLVECALELIKQKTGKEEDFITISNGKRQKKNDITEREKNGLVTKNHFTVLETDDDIAMDDESTPTDPATQTTAKPRPNPPPKPTTLNSDPAGQQKQPKIAHIFLKETEKWKQANALMTREKIRTTKCRLASNGVQIDPAAEDDYRKLKKLFEQENLQFFTYQLKSEKNAKSRVSRCEHRSDNRRNQG